VSPVAALYLLFGVFTAPDGATTLSDVAVVRDRAACEVIASELNASPRMPAVVLFRCRVALKVVQS
jgi:hypothetical protein